MVQILKEAIERALFRAAVRAVPGQLCWAILTLMPLLLVTMVFR